jgi:hypothetical protein
MFAALMALAAVLALAAPWGDRGPDTVQRALAALGSGAVVHAVVEYTGNDAVVELESGREHVRVHRIEWWYDVRRQLFRSRLSTDGIRTSEQVVTPEGGYSDVGRFETGGVVAQLDPSLAAFVTGYRRALEEGDASVAGNTTVDGRAATLLAFRGRSGEVTTVVVDTRSYRPLEFWSRYPGGRRSPTYTIAMLEWVDGDADVFRPPPRSRTRPATGWASEAVGIELAEAERLLGRPPLWVGPERLERVERIDVGSELTDGRRATGRIVRLRYRGRVTVALASDLAGAYALGIEDGVEPEAPAGSIAITRGWGRHDVWEGEMEREGVYVRVTARTRNELLATARSLKPVR